MKEILVELSAHNAWANRQLTDHLQSLPEELLHRVQASSFPSIHLTVLHMWNAESIWWQRVRLQERVQGPADAFTGGFKELSAQLAQQDQLWQDWVQQASEPGLQHVFKYQNTKREPFKQPIYQVLLQIFQHSAYHRGQLVTMLRQSGVTKIPATDFIIWSRSQKAGSGARSSAGSVGSS